MDTEYLTITLKLQLTITLKAIEIRRQNNVRKKASW